MMPQALEQPVELLTMGSVREDPAWRHMPIDAATFLENAHALGQRHVREARGIKPENEIPEGALVHRHLVGDACVVAVKIAQESNGDWPAAIATMRKTFIEGESHPAEATLKEPTDEKIRLAKWSAALFGRPIKVASSLAFLRERGDIATFVIDRLAAVYNERNLDPRSPISVDLEHVDAICDDREENHTKVGIGTTWWRLLRRMLPVGLRTQSPTLTLQELQNSVYGGIEAFIAAAVIRQGPDTLVASYRGSQKVGDRDDQWTIIENMRFLAEAGAVDHLQDAGLAREVRRRFIISPLLDGIGFRAGEDKAVLCDPHTNEMLNGPNGGSATAPTKLPLLVYETPQGIRPVTPLEFARLVKGSGGGMDNKAQKFAWRRAALPLLKAYFHGRGGEHLGRLEEPALKEIFERQGSSVSEIQAWVRSIVPYVLYIARHGEEPTGRVNLDPLLPGRDVDIAATLVSHVAQEAFMR